MGHTISIEKRKVIPVFKIKGTDYYNDSIGITHNLSPIIYEALTSIGGPNIKSFGQWLHGRQCEDAEYILEKLFIELQSNKTKYQKLEPENGFGTLDSLTDTLRQIIEVCKDHPEYYITDFY